MIIHSIHGENVLKYSVLELEDIPAKGLISVTGDNESGKSSIGESICFALFGRTFSLGPDELDKVIRWGESRCSIRLEFSTPDGARYQIARFLDKQGNHGASISREDADPFVRGADEVEARLRSIIGFGYSEFIESFYLAQREISTPNPHSFAVKAMAGVDAMEQAINSCEAEKAGFRDQLDEMTEEKATVDAKIAELNLVEGHLEAMEGDQEALIGGIEALHQGIRSLGNRSLLAKQAGDRVLRGAKQWLAMEHGLSYNDYRTRGERLETLLAEVEPACSKDPCTAEPIHQLGLFAARARLPLEVFATLSEMASAYGCELRRKLGDTDNDAATIAGGDAPNEERVASAPTLAEEHRQLLQGEADLRSDRWQWRLIMIVCLLGAVVLGGWSWFLGPGALGPWASGETEGGFSGLASWLPIGAAALALFALSGWWYGLRLSSHIVANSGQQAKVLAEQDTIRDRIQRLSKLEQIPLGEAVALLQQLGDPPIAELSKGFANDTGLALLDEQEYRKQQALFRNQVVAMTDAVVRSRNEAATEIRALDKTIADDTGKRQVLQRNIEAEQERVGKYRELNAVATNLGNRIGDLSRRIRVRDLGIDLLQGAIHYISQRFNTEVRNLSADSLLKFTNGRYEHLQIDENLNVKAFSNEKRDFMQLDEISSGTQRQIMLAVRMSLAQKLVNSVIQGPQAIFLDEPFAFFDEDRTASSLAVLPEVSGDFSQIWVTSQKFPARSHFDIHIECHARESVSPWIRYTDGRSPSPNMD